MLAQPVIGLDQTELAATRDRCDEAVADVVPDRARRRRASDPRRQERGDLRRARRRLPRRDRRDALGTHEAGARASPGIVLAGCWAHVFRRFEEAAPDHPEAERALAWIGELYEIDRSADER